MVDFLNKNLVFLHPINEIQKTTFQIFLVLLRFPHGWKRMLDPEVLETGVFTTTKLCDLGQVTYPF